MVTIQLDATFCISTNQCFVNRLDLYWTKSLYLQIGYGVNLEKWRATPDVLSRSQAASYIWSPRLDGTPNGYCEPSSTMEIRLTWKPAVVSDYRNGLRESRGLTVSTGHLAILTTFWAHDPMTRCFSPVLPWVPITIRSIERSFTKFMISVTGTPRL